MYYFFWKDIFSFFLIPLGQKQELLHNNFMVFIRSNHLAYFNTIKFKNKLKFELLYNAILLIV